mmetsp:Transcript_303/g.820  ORF Transcript_303/g.820 Transcript_303/m.820 type:complete len:176 (+) Transcript_303:1557-2084(+)
MQQFVTFQALVTLATLVAESYVVFIGALLPDDKSAAVVSPLLLALMMASGGYFVSPAATPLFFRLLNRVNLFRYAFTGLLRNEFEGLTLSCTDAELVGPPPPSTPLNIVLALLHVKWPDRVCPMSSGDEALRRMGVTDLTPRAACMVLVVMAIAYRLAALWALGRRFRSPLPDPA